MPGLFDTIAGVAPSLNAPLYNPSLADPSQGIPQDQSQVQPQTQPSALQMLLGGGQGQSQTPVAPQPSAVPNHSLTGILGIGGLPGHLLNWLGDTIATAAGMHLNFADDPAKRAQAAALSNLQGNPQEAVAKLAATGDTQGALELQNNLANRSIALANMQREGMTAADQHQAAVQKYDDTRRSQAGKLVSAATPDTYESLYGKANDVFGKTTDLSPLNLFSPADVAKYSVVDPKTGQKTWTPEAKAILDQANTFNVPEYKYLGTGAAQTTAAARAQSAQNGTDLADSIKARNYAQAQAAAQNAANGGIRTNIEQGRYTDPVTGQVIPVTDPRLHPQGKSNHHPAPVDGVTTTPTGPAPGAGAPSAQLPTIPANRIPSTAVRGKINGHAAVQVGGKTYLIQ